MSDQDKVREATELSSLPLGAPEIPYEIVEAARSVVRWFAQNNITHWRLLGIGPAAPPAAPEGKIKPPWKYGNEFRPFHPDASHVPPDYRDGWNACYRAAAPQPDHSELLRRADAWLGGNGGYDSYHQSAAGTDWYCSRCQAAQPEAHAADCEWGLFRALAAALRREGE